MVQCQVHVGQCLCLYPLCCIYNQNRSVTSSKTAGYFIIKVHMPRCVNEIENIFFSVFCLIYGADCLGFNRDSTFSFQIHVVQNLCLHFSACKQARHFNNTVCKRRFAMINMGNDTKIANFLLVHMHNFFFSYYFLFYLYHSDFILSFIIIRE